jgi:SAM-dependent methyltransferase
MQIKDYEYLYQLEETFWWFVGMRQVTAAVLDPFCPPGRNRKILDAGCGTGSNLVWLQRYAGDGPISGLDLSPDALQFCRARGQRLLTQASVSMLPLETDYFDLVTSFDVLAQLSGADGESAAAEMFRVLRPGGFAFVRTAAYEWMRSGHDKALSSQRRYSLRELVELLTSVGFSVLLATYANSLLLPVAVLRRLVLKRVGLADPGSDVKPLDSKLRWLNGTLCSALSVEAKWLRTSRRLPTGLSAICVAQKPDTDRL